MTSLLIGPTQLMEQNTAYALPARAVTVVAINVGTSTAATLEESMDGTNWVAVTGQPRAAFIRSTVADANIICRAY